MFASFPSDVPSDRAIHVLQVNANFCAKARAGNLLAVIPPSGSKA